MTKCPKCSREASGDEIGVCGADGGCGHEWNTFLYRGKCPECGKSGGTTKCNHCGERSPSQAWYALGEVPEGFAEKTPMGLQPMPSAVYEAKIAHAFRFKAGEYAPCETCEKKTGSYTLCLSCLHNRTTISLLKAHLSEAARAIENGTKEEDHRGVVYTQTFGQGFLQKLKG